MSSECWLIVRAARVMSANHRMMTKLYSKHSLVQESESWHYKLLNDIFYLFIHVPAKSSDLCKFAIFLIIILILVYRVVGVHANDHQPTSPLPTFPPTLALCWQLFIASSSWHLSLGTSESGKNLTILSCKIFLKRFHLFTNILFTAASDCDQPESNKSVKMCKKRISSWIFMQWYKLVEQNKLLFYLQSKR